MESDKDTSSGTPEASNGFRTASQRSDRRWHRALAIGLLAAVSVHLVALLLFRSVRMLPNPFSAAGPRMGDVRAASGGGGGELTMVEVRPQTAAPVEPPVPAPAPVPEPVPEPEPEPEPERAPAPEAERQQAAVPAPGTGSTGAGGAEGPATGPGTITGTGAGGGGTAEEGQSGLAPPSPRGLFLPPTNPPRSARGKEITVWVFVTAQGRVLSDSVRLDPPTADARYNQRLRRTASEWLFEPARRDGRAVATWFPFWIQL